MNQNDDKKFERLYHEEKRKSDIRKITLAAVVAAVLVVGGLGFWWFGNNSNDEADQGEVASSTDRNFPGGGPRQFGEFDPDNPPEGFEGRPPGGGDFPEGGPRGGGPGGFGVDQFFSSDGSVDQDAVSQFLERIPQGGDSNFLSFFQQNIDQAVEDGDITKSQADALVDALGGSSSETI